MLLLEISEDYLDPAQIGLFFLLFIVFLILGRGGKEIKKALHEKYQMRGDGTEEVSTRRPVEENGLADTPLCSSDHDGPVSISHIVVLYEDLEGRAEEEKFISYALKILDERHGLENLSSVMSTRQMAVSEVFSVIKNFGLTNFNTQYGKKLTFDFRWMANRVVDSLINKYYLPDEWKMPS